MEAVAQLANDLIMLGRSIWSFRHLEHQNLFIISGEQRQSKEGATIPERRRRRRIGGGVGTQLS